MTNRNTGFGVLLLTALTLTSFFGGTPASANSNAGGTITDVNLYTGTTAQGAYVMFASPLGHPEWCTNPADNEIWIDFPSTLQPDGKAIYAAVLAAYLAGRTISFGV